MWTCLILAIMPVADGGAIESPKEVLRSHIDALASRVFAERERATAELGRVGVPAVPHMEAALKSTNVEVRTRSLRIFSEWLVSGDPQLAAAAEAALERAASSRAAVATSARGRLDSNQLCREAALLAEMERLVPLIRLELAL